MRKAVFFLVVLCLVALLGWLKLGVQVKQPGPIFKPHPAVQSPPVKKTPKITLVTDKVAEVVSAEEALANKHGLSWDDGVVPINVSR